MDFDEFHIQVLTDTSGDKVIVLPEDPCDLYVELSFRSSFITPDERHAMDKAYAQCRAKRAQQAPPPVLKPAPRPAPKPAAPDLPPETVQPRIHEDSPDKLEAPAAPVQAAVTRVPGGFVNPVAPTDAVFDQKAPQTPAAVALRLHATPPPDPLLRDLLQRLERNEPMPGESHPSHAGAFTVRPAVDGDPVDLFTGAQLFAAIDLVVPTPWIPIRLERRYRSGRPYYGPFGFGWDHNYNVYLRALKSGSMALWTGSLQEHEFRPTGQGWASAPGVVARLERTAGPGDVFRVVFPEGASWLFETVTGDAGELRWPLTGIADRFGNQLTVTYADSQVTTVLDRAGRGLHFQYGTCGLLERVTDHTGTRVVQYHHDGERAHLVRVVLPATAQFPDGVSTVFEYDAQNPHPAMRHNLLRIVDAQQRTILESQYGGPGDGWNFNAVTRQLVGDFEYRFEYEPVQFVPSADEYLDLAFSRTSVRHPDGTLHVHTFNWRGDLIDHRYRLNRDHTARIVATQRQYDASGNIIEVRTADGALAVFTYDSDSAEPCARHNLLAVELVSAHVGLAASRRVHSAAFGPPYQLPVKVVDETGATTTMEYDTRYCLTSVRMPAATLADGTLQQGVLRFEWNGRGQPTAIVSAEGLRTEITYHTTGPFEGFVHRVIEDPGGIARTTAYEYDPAGFLSAAVAPGGRVFRLAHNGLGQWEEIGAPPIGGIATVVRRFLDDSGGVVRQEAPSGEALGVAAGQPAIEDTMVRNALGHVTEFVQAKGTTAERRWRQKVDYAGRLLSRWAPDGIRTDFVYAESGALIREVHAVGSSVESVTAIHRDIRGRMRRVRDRYGHATDFHYDEWGRLRRVDLPGGSRRELSWGPCNRLLAVEMFGIPASGQASCLLSRVLFEYDERGRLRSQTRNAFDPLNATSSVPVTRTYIYDRDDRLVRIRLHRGLECRYAYDHAGRLSHIESPNGRTQRFIYDVSSDLVQITSTSTSGGQAHTTSRSVRYDERGRPVEFRDGTRVTQQHFDDREMATEVRTVGGARIRLESDALGNVVRTLSGVPGEDRITEFRYDLDGRLTRLTDPAGGITEWTRDPLGRCTRVKAPGGETFQVAFDDQARSIVQTLPSGTQLTWRFALTPDRPTSLSCNAAPGTAAVPEHTFAYDGLGRCMRATAGDQTILRRYDSMGRLRHETARGATVSMRYDDAAGIAVLAYPDGREEATAHDTNGRPVQVRLNTPGVLGGVAGKELLTIQYAPTGQPGSLRAGNGVRSDMQWDELGRLVGVTHMRGAAMLDRHALWHDSAGRPAMAQSGVPLRTQTFTYDGHHRLVETREDTTLPAREVESDPDAQSAVAAWAGMSLAGAAGTRYTLNAADARTRQTMLSGPPSTVIFAPDPNGRPTQTDAAPVDYAADGTRASDDRFQYESDGLGRICRITSRLDGSLVARFEYDALSRPATGWRGGHSYEQWFAGATPIQRRVGASMLQMPPHPLGSGPMCWVEAGASRYLHTDPNSSTMLLADDSGNIDYRTRFSAFGECTVSSGNGVTPADPGLTAPFWGGMEQIDPSGLYLSATRLYDARTGTFLSRDPLLYRDSPSAYAFAGHDPVRFIDPSGLAKVPSGTPSGAPAKRDERSLLQGIQDWLHRDSLGVWFWREPTPGDMVTPLTPADTGSIAGNYAVNLWFSLCNLTAAAINTVGNLTWLGERGLKHIGWSDTDIEALYVLDGAGILRIGEVFSGAKYVPVVLSESAAWRNASRPIAAGAGALAPSPLPEVIVHYDPEFRINPNTSNWLRFTHEWVMENVGYFERGVRLPEDTGNRRLARDFVDAVGDIDRRGENLVAMHPIDDFIGGTFRRSGEVGTTYYFGEAEINGHIARVVNQQLYSLGITQPGQRFAMRFVGFPSLAEALPIAPYASPPNITRQMILDARAASKH